MPALLALAAAAAYPAAAAGRYRDVVAVLGGAAVAVLLAGLAAGWASLVPAALALAGAEYALFLALAREGLDLAAPLVAAGLLLAAELASAALDPPVASRGLRGLVGRLVRLIALAVGAVVLGAAVLVASEVEADAGLLLELVGVAAAVGAVALIAVLARGVGRE